MNSLYAIKDPLLIVEFSSVSINTYVHSLFVHRPRNFTLNSLCVTVFRLNASTNTLQTNIKGCISRIFYWHSCKKQQAQKPQKNSKLSFFFRFLVYYLVLKNYKIILLGWVWVINTMNPVHINLLNSKSVNKFIYNSFNCNDPPLALFNLIQSWPAWTMKRPHKGTLKVNNAKRL